MKLGTQELGAVTSNVRYVDTFVHHLYVLMFGADEPSTCIRITLVGAVLAFFHRSQMLVRVYLYTYDERT